VVTLNNRTYYGVQDSDNAFFEDGRRYLVSDLDALILQDSYGYTINRPLSNNMYIIFDPTFNALTIRGSSAGEKIYPGQANPHNDAILVTTTGNPQLASPNYEVFVTIGDPVPGTSGQLLYSGTFSETAVSQIDIDAGDGANTISVDALTSNTKL